MKTKTYSAMLVAKQYHVVRATVPNNYKIQQIEEELCAKANLVEDDFVIEVYHIREVKE